MLPSRGENTPCVQPTFYAFHDEVCHNIRCMLTLQVCAESSESISAGAAAFDSRAAKNMVCILPQAVAFVTSSIVDIVNCLKAAVGGKEIIHVLQ